MSFSKNFLLLCYHSVLLVISIYYFIVLNNLHQNIFKTLSFLTNISQFATLIFYVLIIIFDVKKIFTKTKQNYRYPTIIYAFYIIEQPVSAGVLTIYFSFVLIDPKLLFPPDAKLSPFSIEMLYTHGINTLFFWLEIFFYRHKKVFSNIGKLKINSIVIIAYIFIQFVHFLILNEHVYPFMSMLDWSSFILLYLTIYLFIAIQDYIFTNFVLILFRNVKKDKKNK